MAQLANCPQCDHELLVPDDAAVAAWARCPSCRAFFQLKDANSRELPTIELVEAAFAADRDELHTGEHDELPLAGEPDSVETQHASIAQQDTTKADDFNFADLEAILGEQKPPADAPRPTTPAPAAAWRENVSEADDLQIADGDDDTPLDLETPPAEASGAEALEQAAERIDAWFRSAKTVADVPAPEDPAPQAAVADTPPPPKAEIAVESAAAANATIELGGGGIDELGLSDDFELDQSSAEPHEGAAWDDAQRMDQLLSGVEDMPTDEFSPAEEDGDSQQAEQHEAPTARWSPQETASQLTKGGKPRRNRSFARTFAMSAAGGVIGLALGYYALLWYQGPAGDFLNWANWLPKAMLPSSFHGSSRLMVAAPVAPRKTAEAPPAEPASEPAPPANETPETAAAAEAPKTAPAEQQASFTTPATAEQPAANKDDRYAAAATTANKPAEPATLDAPPAEPLKEAAPAPEPIQLQNTPSFTADDLAAALANSNEAARGLVEGNLADGAEVAKRKGASYLVLADLARKVTFVDPTAADLGKMKKAADTLFGETLANSHAREEVAQIVPKWLASPKSQQGGVFFAGSVVSQETKGSVAVCTVDLGNGQSLPVLVPAAVGEQLKGSAAPVAVVGWLVDKPAETIANYTGTAPHVVFAGRVIPLP